jgi:TonB family protein
LVHVTEVDYPADVDLVRGVSRHSVLSVSVEPGGRVIGCRIASSSGEPRLDAESCRILRERAVLRPAALRGRITFRWYPEQPHPPVRRRGEPLLLSSGPLIRNGDYPRAARRRNEAGEVHFRVHVSSSGRPLSCAVTRSSGSADLNRQTCALVMQRADFIPEVDDQGGRVDGTYRGSVKWML